MHTFPVHCLTQFSLFLKIVQKVAFKKILVWLLLLRGQHLLCFLLLWKKMIKSDWEGRGSFTYSFQLQTIPEESQGRAGEAGTEAEAMEGFGSRLSPLAGSVCFLIQHRASCPGFLGPLRSNINQNMPVPQTWPQVNLMVVISQLKFPLSGCLFKLKRAN